MVVDCLVVFMPGSSDLHFVVHPFGAVGDLLVCICRRLASDIESTAQIEAGQLGWPQMLCLLHAAGISCFQVFVESAGGAHVTGQKWGSRLLKA